MKERKKWTVLLTLGAILTLSAVAQTRSPVVEPRIFVPPPPYTVLKYQHTPPANMDTGEEISTHEVYYHGELPLSVDEPLRFAAWVDGQWTHLSVQDEGTQDFDLFGVFGTLDASYDWMPSLVLGGRIALGLSSDFDEIDNNDKRVRGQLTAELPFRNGTVFAGAAYDQVLGDDQWHPVGGLRWMAMPELLVELAYPQSRLVLAPSKGTAFEVRTGYAGNNWTIFYLKEEHNLKIEGYATEVAAEFGLSDALWIRLFGGWLTERSIEIWKGERRPLSGDVDDSYYVGLALLWR